LGFDPGENVKKVVFPGDYSGTLLFCFADGKVARIPLSAYETKTNRRRLTGAYGDKSPLKTILQFTQECQAVAYTTDCRALIFSTAQLTPKSTRSAQGVSVVTLKKKAELDYCLKLEEAGIVNVSRYRTRNIPAAGALLKEEDAPEKQITLDI
jgi:DNA gyrase subunit A